jgi:predicted NUDIX family NTP pyrophosphohydrolase
MPKQSAGLLLYRTRENTLEVFLVHPGGPFWAKKDAAAWSIPKGEFAAGDDPLAAAQREFTEETGFIATGPFHSLGTVRATASKTLHAFAAVGDFDADKIVSNTFQLQWPPRSGRFLTVPEVDRAGWFPLSVAREKIHTGQLELLTRLEANARARFGSAGGPPAP